VQTGPAIGINTLGTTTISIPQQEQLTLQPQQQTTLQVQTQATAVTATATTAAAAATTTGGSGGTSGKKKKRKKRSKDRKPKLRPGEIRLGTALDGSPLYMCPECHVAYPEPELLEVHPFRQHLPRQYSRPAAAADAAATGHRPTGTHPGSLQRHPPATR